MLRFLCIESYTYVTYFHTIRILSRQQDVPCWNIFFKFWCKKYDVGTSMMQTKLPIELSLRHVGYIDVFFLMHIRKCWKIVEKEFTQDSSGEHIHKSYERISKTKLC